MSTLLLVAIMVGASLGCFVLGFILGRSEGRSEDRDEPDAVTETWPAPEQAAYRRAADDRARVAAAAARRLMPNAALDAPAETWEPPGRMRGAAAAERWHAEHAEPYAEPATAAGPAPDGPPPPHPLDAETDRMPTVAELAAHADYGLTWRELQQLTTSAWRWYEDTYQTGQFRAVTKDRSTE